jgi:UDP-N-acetylmuramoyl-tripeptide--D-alanyl-D-alanine ligase
LEELSIREVIQAIKGRALGGDVESGVTGVSTDTRALRPGDLFIALAGDQSNGHAYVRHALEMGAGGIVVSDEAAVPAACRAAAIHVDDTLWALGDLAAYYRNKFDVKVVGVTGSVGKTTTKEMLASILALKWSVLKNELNFNNEIGVPATLFNLDRGHEVAVIEMAMRGFGEIRRLAQIARPSVGVITNVGISHIERLGSQGAIANAKSELLSELPPDGLAVLNMEDGYYPILKDRFAGRTISFGSCKGADVMGARIKVGKDGRYTFVIMIEGGAIEVRLPSIGYHNVYNALSAAAAAVGMGVDLYTIRDGLQSFSQPAMRMELMEAASGCAVLNDSYNANPASMLAALKTLHSLAGYSRKIAVLGDMLELGDYASKAHRDIGHAVVANGVDMLVAVGDLGQEIAAGARDAGLADAAIRIYADSLEAALSLKGQVADGDVLLVKGSRGMRMEEIVRVLVGD